MKDSDDRADADWYEAMSQDRRDALALHGICSERDISMTDTLNVPTTVRRLHTVVCDYHSYFVPYASRGVKFPGWDERIATVSVPVEGQYDAGRTDSWGEADWGDSFDIIEFTEVPVSCSNVVSEWLSGKRVSVTLEMDDGEVAESHTFHCHFSAAISRRLLTQLDIIRGQIRWLPDPGSVGSDDEPPEAPEHARKNAPAYQGKTS